MKKILPLVAVAFLGLTAPAHATMLTINLGAGGGSDFSIIAGGAGLTPDIDLLTTSNLSLDHNASLINPPTTLVNYYVQPTGPIFGSNGGTFLSVYGQSGPDFTFDPGQATFTMLPNKNSLGFTWGTVDDYNVLTLTDSRGVVYNIGGADILAALVNPVPGTTQTDVRFTDSFGNITSAMFQSFQNSFEVANVEDATSAVPLPASLPLLGSGLLMLALMGRRKEQQI